MYEFHTQEGKKAAVKAMHLLEYRGYTVRGLSEKLRQSSFSEEAVEEAIAYVSSFGYLNDERYAQSYISTRAGKKSKRKITQELLGKGVSRETIEEVWEQQAEFMEVDEQEILRELVQKKYPAGVPNDARERRRLYGYLERRGFASSDICNVLREEEF